MIAAHGSGFWFAVDHDYFVIDGMQTQYSSLRQIDDWGTKERSKDASVADSVSTAGHVLDGQLVVASLWLDQSSVKASETIVLTFLPSSEIAASIPTMSSVSAFRTTGVTRPFSVATATLTST